MGSSDEAERNTRTGTERRSVLAAALQQALLESLLESLEHAAVLAGPDERLRLANHPARVLLGIQADEPLDCTVADWRTLHGRLQPPEEPEESLLADEAPGS